MPRRSLLAAAALGLLVAALLSRGHRNVGYVRDEGIYFQASRVYADWAAQVLADPRLALDRPLRDRAFTVNHEHPALLKLAAGLSARLFSAPGPESQPPEARAPAGALPLLPEGAAMRLPAQLLAGLGAALLFLAGASLARRARPAPSAPSPAPSPAPPQSPAPSALSPAPSPSPDPSIRSDPSPAPSALSSAPPPSPAPSIRSDPSPAPSALSPAPSPSWPLAASAGLLAALWFIGLPHVWYHAGLHCFDVPVAVLTLATVLCYRRALASARWSLLLGPLLGVAIAVKHNALFIPVLLGVHYLAGLALARRRPTLGQLVPLPFLSMAILAPLTALALWPWLWADPLARLAEYLEFHRHHAYYNTEYLGINFNQPPLPWSYPWLLTWATVPTTLLLLAAIGLALALRRDLSSRTPPDLPRPAWSAPLRGHPARDGLLWALFGLFPLALISLPSIPIFGGTKHWLTAYPFLALAAAHAWVSLWRRIPLAGRAAVLPLALVPVLLAPALWATWHGHPFGASQYAPLVGGTRGAAELGLMRGFWGGSVLPLLPHAAGTRLYPHDLHDLARLQYEREGRWPAGTPVAPISRASAGLLFHERHMLSSEVDLWNHLGTTAPAQVLTLDDVPLTSLYAAPPRAP